MSYTWTGGEVITAEKLNQTGGGSSNIFVGSIGGYGTSNYYTYEGMEEIRSAYDKKQLMFFQMFNADGDVRAGDVLFVTELSSTIYTQTPQWKLNLWSIKFQTDYFYIYDPSTDKFWYQDLD